MTTDDWFERALFGGAVEVFVPDMLWFVRADQETDYSEVLRERKFCRICHERMMRVFRETFSGKGSLEKALNEPMALYETLRNLKDLDQ